MVLTISDALERMTVRKPFQPDRRFQSFHIYLRNGAMSNRDRNPAQVTINVMFGHGGYSDVC